MDDREQILRRGYEAWNRGDFEAVEEAFHPGVELDATHRVLNPARYTGIAGLRQLTRETFDTWEEWSIEPTRFLWNGDRVLVETRIDARGRGSGIRLSETYYTIWTVENLRGTRMELHVDVEKAFASFGLPRPGGW